MADESTVSLLFKLKADAAETVAGTAVARAAVTQLRQTFGAELSQMATASKSAFDQIGEQINPFIRARVPVGGGLVVGLSDNLRSLSAEANTVSPSLQKLNNEIGSLAEKSGKGKAEIGNFLTTFLTLPNAAARNDAAFKLFGGSVDEVGNKTAAFLPELENAAATLGTVSEEAATTGASFAGMAGPIGIALLAVVAMTAGVVLLTQEFLTLSKQTADVQGQMYDLSQQTGVAVETLSALEIASETTGGNLGTIAQSLGIFQRKLDETRDPASKTAATFRDLGISTENTEVALRESLATLAKMPEGYEQTALALDLFGRGGKSLLAILKETNGDLDAAIDRYKELGLVISTEDAKAADEFNDQLAILQFQVRAATFALVKEALPALLSILDELSRILKKNKETIDVIGIAITTFVNGNAIILLNVLGLIEGAIDRVAEAWLSMKAAAIVASQDTTETWEEVFQRLKKARDEGKATASSGITTVAGKAEADGITGVAEGVGGIGDLKRKAEEAARLSDEKIQRAQLEFKQGKILRDQETAQILGALKDRRDAALRSLQAEIQDKAEEQKLHEGEITKYRQLGEEKAKLEDDARKVQSDYRMKVADEENKAAEARNKAIVEEINKQVDLQKAGAEAYINVVKAKVKEGTLLASEGEDEITKIENDTLEVRRDGLKQQMALFSSSSEEYRALLQTRAELENEATRIAEEQAERRREITKAEIQLDRDLLLQRMETIGRLADISAGAQIATIQAVAALGLKSEEEAAEAIGRIRLSLIDLRVEAEKAKLTATGTISDPAERKRQQAAINDQIKILGKERVSQEEQNNRDIDAGRRKDIQNFRDYQDSLTEIQEDNSDQRRRIADSEIEWMRLNHASRREILEAERTADLTALDAQRDAAIAQILREKRDAVEAMSTRKLSAEDRLRLLREYGEKQLQTEEQFERRRRILEKRYEVERIKAGKEGGFLSGLETGQLATLEEGVQSFADVSTVAFSAIGAAVNGLAQGVGQLINNWVLMGEVGPGAMRKVVASVLASVAQQAAVQAIMCTAYGVAALTPWGAAIFGPATQWFEAAALFASVAVGSALVGRAVAGDTFKQTSDTRGGFGTGAGSGGGNLSGGGTGSGGGPQVINIGRNVVVDHIVTIKAEKGFIANEVVRELDRNHQELTDRIQSASRR